MIKSLPIANVALRLSSWYSHTKQRFQQHLEQIRRDHLVSDALVQAEPPPPSKYLQATKLHRVARMEALLDLDWVDRCSVWEGQDGQWYGCVREVGGWRLCGPYADDTEARHLVNYEVRCLRDSTTQEIHRLKNWPGYGDHT